MTDELTGDPRSKEEKLRDEARARMDEPPPKNPDAVDWPEDVKTERIDD